jgi:hypothetical protein
VKRTDFMFESAESFNQPLAAWNLKNVETMERMFFKAKAFNQPLADWDVSKVKKWRPCSRKLKHSTKISELGMCQR